MIDLDVDNEKPLAHGVTDVAGILFTAIILACGAASMAGLIWVAYEVLSWIG